MEEDKCWALLRELGLGNITPPPDYSQKLDTVKANSFGHLLKKHQGQRSVAYQLCPSEDESTYIRVLPVKMMGFDTMIVFLIADLQVTLNKAGMRCMRIQPIFRQVKDPVTDEGVEVKLRGGMLEGFFQGVIDIWAPEEDLTECQYLHKLTLFSGA